MSLKAFNHLHSKQNKVHYRSFLSSAGSAKPLRFRIAPRCFHIFNTKSFFVPRILKRYRSKGFEFVSAGRTILGFVDPAELKKVR